MSPVIPEDILPDPYGWIEWHERNGTPLKPQGVVTPPEEKQDSTVSNINTALAAEFMETLLKDEKRDENVSFYRSFLKRVIENMCDDEFEDLESKILHVAGKRFWNLIRRC